ncbi:MAG: isochorismatase family protein [Alphaproteobacteria bacterium]
MAGGMEIDRTTSTPDAHEALQGKKIVNLIIDTGDFTYSPLKPGSVEDQRKAHDTYIKGLKDTAAALRKEGIPTVYIAITDHNQIHDAWNANTVSRLHMTELDPQPGDVVFEKRFMSGFPTMEDLQQDSKYAYLSRQRPADPVEAFVIGEKHTLTHLLKDAQHIIVNGAMGQFCVVDNSIDAAGQGKTVTILQDNVAVWTKMEGEYWKNPANIATNDPAFAGRAVQAMLDELKDNPAKRAIPPATVAKMSNIEIGNARDLLENLHVLQEDVENRPPPGVQASKYAGRPPAVLFPANAPAEEEVKISSRGNAPQVSAARPGRR